MALPTLQAYLTQNSPLLLNFLIGCNLKIFLTGLHTIFLLAAEGKSKPSKYFSPILCYEEFTEMIQIYSTGAKDLLQLFI